MSVALGFDIGGHHIRGAAVSDSGEILFKEGLDTPKGRAPLAVLNAVEAVYQKLKPKMGTKKVVGLGFGFPGFLDAAKGMILKSPNFPEWDHFELRAALEKRFTGKLAMDNDANCAALGEAWVGSSKGLKHSILVTLGTGVGGGIVVNGQLLRGAHGAAGEFGHAVIEPDGPPCGCGGNGCLERLISGDAIRKDTGEGVETWATLARSGDAKAKEVFHRMGRYLGISFASLCSTFDPEILIVGGRIALAFDLFVPSLEKELRRRIANHPASRARVVPASLGDDAGLLGAASLVLR